MRRRRSDAHAQQNFGAEGGRFSLRSLLLFVLLATSATALAYRATPWAVELVLRGHEAAVTMAFFSADGERILTGDSEGTVRIWDSQTGRTLAALKGESAWYSPDDTLVATCDSSRDVRIYSAGSGVMLAKVSGAHYLCFSTDSTKVATATPDRRAVTVFESGNGERVAEMRGHGDVVASASFSPDGRHVVSVGYDFRARFWEASTGREIRVLGDDSHLVASACFSPDGGRIATAGRNDYAVRIWDSGTGRCLKALSGHTDEIYAVRYLRGGSRLISASRDLTVRTWEEKTGKCLRIIEISDYPIHWGVSPDERLLIVSDSYRNVTLWDMRSGKHLASFLLPGIERISRHVCQRSFSPDGTRIVLPSRDNQARVWARRRPEPWWGVVWLLEFWATVILAGLFIWSLYRDRKYFKSLDAKQAETSP